MQDHAGKDMAIAKSENADVYYSAKLFGLAMKPCATFAAVVERRVPGAQGGAAVAPWAHTANSFQGGRPWRHREKDCILDSLLLPPGDEGTGAFRPHQGAPDALPAARRSSRFST